MLELLLLEGSEQFLNKRSKPDLELHWQNSLRRQLRGIPPFQAVAIDLEKRLKEAFAK